MVFFLISLMCCCCCNVDFEKSFSENVDEACGLITIAKDIGAPFLSGATVAADEGNGSSTKDDDDVSWKLSGWELEMATCG